MTKFLCGECIHNSDKGGGCLIPKNLGYVDNCNRYLPKDRPIVQTNEEWFCGISTEEKAEFLVMIQMSVMHPVKRGAVDMDMFIEDVADWLKQPHKE